MDSKQGGPVNSVWERTEIDPFVYPIEFDIVKAIETLLLHWEIVLEKGTREQSRTVTFAKRNAS